MSKVDLIIGTPSLADILDRMQFTEQTLPTAVLEQAKLYVEATRYRVRKMRARHAAELELQKVQAELAVRIREILSAKGKVTEGKINNRLDASPRLFLLRKKVNDAEQLEEWSKGLQDALRMRRDMLQVYARLVSTDADMRIKDSTAGSLAEKARKLREKYPGREEI